MKQYEFEAKKLDVYLDGENVDNYKDIPYVCVLATKDKPKIYGKTGFQGSPEDLICLCAILLAHVARTIKEYTGIDDVDGMFDIIEAEAKDYYKKDKYKVDKVYYPSNNFLQ